MQQRLLIVTTAPETIAFILQSQPKYLNQYFDVSLATSPGREIEYLLAEKVPLHLLKMERGISPLEDLISLIRMTILLRKIRPNIIHSYTPKAGLLSMLAARLCGVPIRIHTFTGLIWPTTTGWRRKLLMTTDRILCFCATRLIPEGLGVKKDLQKFNITSKPLQVIGYGNIAGVDTSYFLPTHEELIEAANDLRQSNNIKNEEFVYVFVGRLNRDKGIRELLLAFEQLPDNSQLLIVGGIDKSAPISEQELKIMQEHPRIHWLGFQSDIRPALLAADIMVLPSYREGFPNVILQAGAMELPVIATDISGCNEVIEPGLNGWLVPPRNTETLSEAMRTALETPKDKLRVMGKSARACILERFERQGHWKRMLAFYRSLILQSNLKN